MAGSWVMAAGSKRNDGCSTTNAPTAGEQSFANWAKSAKLPTYEIEDYLSFVHPRSSPDVSLRTGCELWSVGKPGKLSMGPESRSTPETNERRDHRPIQNTNT